LAPGLDPSNVFSAPFITFIHVQMLFIGDQVKRISCAVEGATAERQKATYATEKGNTLTHHNNSLTELSSKDTFKTLFCLQ